MLIKSDQDFKLLDASCVLNWILPSLFCPSNRPSFIHFHSNYLSASKQIKNENNCDSFASNCFVSENISSLSLVDLIIYKFMLLASKENEI
jgi:hypothetical protein